MKDAGCPRRRPSLLLSCTFASLLPECASHFCFSTSSSFVWSVLFPHQPWHLPLSHPPPYLYWCLCFSLSGLPILLSPTFFLLIWQAAIFNSTCRENEPNLSFLFSSPLLDGRCFRVRVDERRRRRLSLRSPIKSVSLSRSQSRTPTN